MRTETTQKQQSAESVLLKSEMEISQEQSFAKFYLALKDSSARLEF